MNDPQRLALSGDDFETELLRSAKGDAPSQRSRARTLAMLGVAGSLAGSAGVASAAIAGPAAAKAALGAGAAASAGAATSAVGAGATVAGAAAGATAAGATAMGATALIVVKWVGIAAVTGLGVWGVARQAASSPASPTEPTASAVIAGATRAPNESNAATQAVTTAVDARAAQAKTAEPAESGDTPPGDRPSDTIGVNGSVNGGMTAASSRSTATAGAPAAPSARALGDEIAALDRAHASMDGGNYDAALRAIDAYQREFPRAKLGQEAEIVRIEALAGKGDLASARAAVQSFLARHPSSPAAQHLQSLVGAP